MSRRYCNIILAATQQTVNLIIQNITVNPATGERYREDITDGQARKLRNSISRSGSWGPLNISGTDYYALDMYMPREFDEATGDLIWFKFLKDNFPTRFNDNLVVAAFDRDGFQLQAEWQDGARDENGDYILPAEPPEPTGWVRRCYTDRWKLVACNDPDARNLIWYKTGSGLYSQNARALEIMPDIVEYDENGDEISRTPATEFPIDLARRSGWGVRRWV